MRTMKKWLVLTLSLVMLLALLPAVTALAAEAGEGGQITPPGTGEVPPGYYDYAINYVLNGGENDPSNPSGYQKADGVAAFADPVREGYKFAGWYTTAKFKTKLTKIAPGSTKDKTLYAKWTGIKYTVTFDGNGKTSGTMKAQKLTYGASTALTANAFKKTGYTFTGWNTQPDGTGTAYANKQKAIDAVTEDGGAITLYAQWSKDVYTVTYKNVTADEIPAENITEYSVDSDAFTLAAPERAGYTFGGWYSNSKLSAKATGIPTGSTGNKTFYAKWTANTYKISFDGNGKTSGSVKTLTVTFNKAKALTANAFKKTGYTFTGWNTRPDGTGTAYANKASVLSLTDVKGEEIKLYAQWSLNNYTVTYKNVTADEIPAENVTEYTVEDAACTLAAPERTGYTFGGWYTTSKYKTRVTEIAARSTGNKTFYAKWIKDTYAITYELNGGTNSKSNPKSYSVVSSTITFKDPTRKGFTFDGWFTDPDFIEPITQIPAGSTGAITVFAKWTIIPHTVTYVLNGGENDPENVSVYTVEDESFTLKAPTKEGYTFVGWYTTSAFKTKATQIAAGSTGNKTFYAKWTAITYKLSFSGNGSTSGKMTDLTVTYDKAMALTANAFARTGYTFTGWNTRPDGTGDAYDNKASVLNLTAVKGEEITLYAQWEINAYTIAYNLNGGENNPENPDSYSVTSDAITLADPTRTGYTFEGWYTNSKLTTKGSAIPAGSTGNKTFYAKWKIISYSVTYVLNGGTNDKSNPDTYTLSDRSLSLAPATGKTGYSFTGWYKDPGCSLPATDIFAGTVGDCTFYAGWRPNTYTVKFDLNAPDETLLTGSLDDVLSCTYDEVVPFPTCTFSCGDYVFVGWTINYDDSWNGIGCYPDVAMEDGMPVSPVYNLTDADGAEVTLHAIWMPSPVTDLAAHKISYNAIGLTFTPVENADGYTVLYSDDGGESSLYVTFDNSVIEDNMFPEGSEYYGKTYLEIDYLTAETAYAVKVVPTARCCALGNVDSTPVENAMTARDVSAITQYWLIQPDTASLKLYVYNADNDPVYVSNGDAYFFPDFFDDPLNVYSAATSNAAVTPYTSVGHCSISADGSLQPKVITYKLDDPCTLTSDGFLATVIKYDGCRYILYLSQTQAYLVIAPEILEGE